MDDTLTIRRTACVKFPMNSHMYHSTCSIEKDRSPYLDQVIISESSTDTHNLAKQFVNEIELPTETVEPVFNLLNNINTRSYTPQADDDINYHGPQDNLTNLVHHTNDMTIGVRLYSARTANTRERRIKIETRPKNGSPPAAISFPWLQLPRFIKNLRHVIEDCKNMSHQ